MLRRHPERNTCAEIRDFNQIIESPRIGEIFRVEVWLQYRRCVILSRLYVYAYTRARARAR